MDIFVNKEKLSFELENEKTAYDVVTALASYYAKEQPQQFITQIIIDGKEFSYADEESLKAVDLSSPLKLEFEFRDIVGVSLLSIRQIELYLDFIAELVHRNRWNEAFPNAIESFTWMEQGISQIVNIFGANKGELSGLKEKFQEKYRTLEGVFVSLKQEDFPLREEKQEENLSAIKEVQSILLKFYKSLNITNNPTTKEELLGQLTKLLETFDEVTPLLSEVPIQLQKGEDKDAMEIIQKLTVLIDKVISIFLLYKELDVEYFQKLQIRGTSLETFFDQMMVHLKELEEAIGNKDSVMIGDLVEYEFLPNMEDLKDLLTKLKEEFLNKLN